MPQIFISYAPQDTNFARQIEAKLVEHGFRLSNYFEEFRQHPDLTNTLGSIDFADAVVVLISPHTHRSPLTESAYIYAQHRQVPVISVLLDARTPIPMPLRSSPVINAYTNLESHIGELVNYLSYLTKAPAISLVVQPISSLSSIVRAVIRANRERPLAFILFMAFTCAMWWLWPNIAYLTIAPTLAYMGVVSIVVILIWDAHRCNARDAKLRKEVAWALKKQDIEFLEDWRHLINVWLQENHPNEKTIHGPHQYM